MSGGKRMALIMRHGIFRFLYVIISIQVLMHTFSPQKPAHANTTPYTSQIAEARQQYESGKKFFEERNLDKACESLEKAIEKDPHYIDAYLQYGKVLRELHIDGKAEEIFQAVIKECPKNAEVYYLWGNLLASRGQAEKAIEKYKEAIQNNPEYAEAYWGWGRAIVSRTPWYVGGTYCDETIEKLERAIKLKPHYKDAYNELFECIYRFKGEKREERLAFFQKGIEGKDPETRAMVYYVWGVTLSRQTKYKEALGKYEAARQIKPDYPDVYRALALNASLCNEYDDAIKYCKEAIGREADFAKNDDSYLFEILFNLPEEYQQKTIETITAELEKIDSSMRATAVNKWGQFLWFRGRYEDATEQYQKAIKLNPDLAEANCNLGDAFNRLGKYGMARDLYLKAISLKPDYYDVSNRLGNTLIALGEYENALEQYKNAMRINSLSVNFQDLVKALDALLKDKKGGDIEEGIHEVLRNKLPFASALAYRQWGDALCRSKKHKEAIYKYCKAIEIYPDLEDRRYGSNMWNNMATSLKNLSKSEKEQAIKDIQAVLNSKPAAISSKLYTHWGDALEAPDDSGGKYMKAIELNPNNSIAYELWGNALYKQKYYEEAIDKFRKATELKPDSANVYKIYNKWGDSLYELKKYHEAFEMYQKAIEIEPSSIDQSGLAKAIAGMSAEEQVKSTAEIEKIIESKAPVIAAYAYECWGSALFRSECYAQAVERYKKSIALNDDSYRVYTSLGDVFYEQKKFDDAITWYSKATEINLEYLDAYDAFGAYQKWGDALLELKNYREAIEKYQRAIYFGYFSVQFNKLHEALENLPKEDKEKTITDINDILKDKPFREKIYFYGNWVSSLEESEKYDEALNIYKKLLALDPNSIDYRSLVDTINRLPTEELKKAAIKSIDEILQGYPSTIGAYTYNDWGNVLYNSKKKDEAIERYRKAIKIKPDYFNAVNNLAETLSETEKYAEADRMFRKSQKMDTGGFSYYTYFLWGNALFGLKQYEESIQKYEEAIKLKYDSGTTKQVGFSMPNPVNTEDSPPGSPPGSSPKDTFGCTAHNNIGLAYFNMKIYGRAIEHFERANKCNPDYINAYKNCACAFCEMGDYHKAVNMFKIVLEKTINAPGNKDIKSVYEDVFSLCGIILNEIKGKEREECVKAFQDIIDNCREDDCFEVYRLWGTVLVMCGEHDEAEIVLKKGLEIEPENADILLGLVDLYMKKAESPATKGKEDDGKADAYKFAWEYYSKVVESLAKQNESKDASALIELYQVHLRMAENEKALFILQTIEKDDKMFENLKEYEKGNIFRYLGLLQEHTVNNESSVRYFKKAAEWFGKALKKEPTNLHLHSLLAEAYYNSNNLERAESEYQKILKRKDNYANANIGLGKVYLAMAEAEKGEEGNEGYERAIEYFDKGINTMKNRSFNEQSNGDIADAYYLRGCAKLKMCKSAKGFNKNDGLLADARCDFESCFAMNPVHYKAKRAKEKIADAMSHSPYQHFTNWLCPWMILGFSVIIFLLSVCKLFFIKQENNNAPEGKDNQPAKADGFLKRVFSSVFGAGSNTVYVTLIFAAFLAASFVPFLPQISKMKLGALEVEKDSVEQKLTSKSFIDIEKGLQGVLETKGLIAIDIGTSDDKTKKYEPPKLDKGDASVPNQSRDKQLWNLY